MGIFQAISVMREKASDSETGDRASEGGMGLK